MPLRANAVLDVGGFGGERMRRNISVRLMVANGMLGAPVAAASSLDRPVAPFHRVPAKLYDGTEAKIRMAPFGNLGRWYADAAAKPAITEKLYPYAVWIPAY